jgi:hypothetical protein
MELDGGGNVYLTGYTLSADLPVTSGTIESRPAGSTDAFVAKLAPDGIQTADVYPNTGTGYSSGYSSSRFRFHISARATQAWMLFNSSPSAANGCFLAYDAASNMLGLLNDAATQVSYVTVGTSGSASNSYCTVNAANSSIVTAGSDLYLYIAVTFTAAFGGSKNIYMISFISPELTSGWVQVGTWAVPASAPPTASVTPRLWYRSRSDVHIYILGRKRRFYDQLRLDAISQGSEQRGIQLFSCVHQRL